MESVGLAQYSAYYGHIILCPRLNEYFTASLQVVGSVGFIEPLRMHKATYIQQRCLMCLNDLVETHARKGRGFKRLCCSMVAQPSPPAQTEGAVQKKRISSLKELWKVFWDDQPAAR